METANCILKKAIVLKKNDVFYLYRDHDCEEPLVCLGREEEDNRFIVYRYLNEPGDVIKCIKENRPIWVKTE